MVALAHRHYGSGPPIIILHGLFGSSRNWSTIAGRLAPSRAVFALDLRNHGDSPWTDAMGYEAMAGDLLEFMDRQGLERAVVLGHSMGGKAAMALALSAADRVEALVVVDIAPAAYPPAFHGYVAALQGVDLSQAPRRSDVDSALRSAVPDAGIRAFLLQNLVTDGDGARWRLNLAALDTEIPELGGFPVGLLEGIYRGPSLFVTGGLSDFVQPHHQGLIETMFTDVSFAEVDRAGHWVHAEAPEPFLAILGDFLARLPAQRAA